MFYQQLQGRKDEEFFRLVGVKRPIFESMVGVLREQIREFGRPCKLSLADQMLLCLMYWREYRTMAHVALAYGVSEPTVHRTIGKVEAALSRSGAFTLPGKKLLRGQELVLEAVLVDATEMPVQRPKAQKTARLLLRQEKTPHLQSPNRD